MSSDMKDARWGLALTIVGGIGLDYEDFTYEGWEKMLTEAQRRLDKTPDDVVYWAERFRE